MRFALERTRSNRWTSETGFPFAERSAAATTLFRFLLGFLIVWLVVYTLVATVGNLAAGMNWAGLAVIYLLATPCIKLLTYLSRRRGRIPSSVYPVVALTVFTMVCGALWVWASVTAALNA